MSNTKLDLDALEAVARAATPGPWEWEEYTTMLVAPGKNVILWIENAMAPNWDDSNAWAEALGCLGNSAEKRATQNSAHIAAFDPATVLALLALARRGARLAELLRRANEYLDVNDQTHALVDEIDAALAEPRQPKA